MKFSSVKSKYLGLSELVQDSARMGFVVLVDVKHPTDSAGDELDSRLYTLSSETLDTRDRSLFLPKQIKCKR